MHIEVKCFASLACHAPKGGRLELPQGATVGTVMHTLSVQPEDVKIIFINGVHAEASSPLKEGDRLGLIPAVGGG